MEVENITKAAAFKRFLHLSNKKTQLLFFVTVLFNIFIRQTLTNDFWGLHKNMNCKFPLICPLILSFSAFYLVFVYKNCPLIFVKVGVKLLCGAFLIKATLDADLRNLDIVFFNFL